METVGERIRRLRIERGLSQRDIACDGVTNAYISRLEAGARTPSVKALRKIAGRLGVTADYLENGEEPRVWVALAPGGAAAVFVEVYRTEAAAEKALERLAPEGGGKFFPVPLGP